MKWHLCCHLQLQRSLKIFMSRYLSFRPWLSRLYHPAVQRVSPSYQVSCLLWVGNRECVKTWHGVVIVVIVIVRPWASDRCTIFIYFPDQSFDALGKSHFLPEFTFEIACHNVSQLIVFLCILQNCFWICPWFFWWKAVDYRIREQFIFVSKWPWGLPKRISFSRNLVLDLGQAYCGLNRFWIATHSTSFSCSLPGMLKVKCIEILLFLYLWYFLLQD